MCAKCLLGQGKVDSSYYKTIKNTKSFPIDYSLKLESSHVPNSHIQSKTNGIRAMFNLNKTHFEDWPSHIVAWYKAIEKWTEPPKLEETHYYYTT